MCTILESGLENALVLENGFTFARLILDQSSSEVAQIQPTGVPFQYEKILSNFGCVLDEIQV
jgi:hypothetical protein